MNEPYQDVVIIHPPERSSDGETVLLKFHVRSGEVIRLRLYADVARSIGTQLLLLSPPAGTG